jgi:NADP-dependent 3-hydroxy acid dehydrogenase YdfG/acyl carrier protein
MPVSPDGLYLISGGLGGLGLVVARWLAAQGARHLALFGRRAPNEHTARTIAELRAVGVDVLVSRGDVAQADDVQRILDELPSGVPLRGVVHAAGVFEAGVLTNLDASRFESVMRPKVDGAMNLHDATLDRNLDFFVLFSSVSAVLGFPGVANYAAANAALDALAIRRRAEKRPGLSIAWGPWSDVGLIAARAQGGQRLAADGLGAITPEEGALALGHALGSGAGQLLITRLDVERWTRAYPFGTRSLLRDLRPKRPSIAAADGIGARLRAMPPGGRREALEAWLRGQLGQVLRTATAGITTSEPFKAMGLDSLLSLELRHRIERALTIVVPVTAIWNFPTILALAGHLLGRLEPADAGPEISEPDAGDIEQILAEVEQLSDHEVQRILSEGEPA